jgi:hypothetical protein
MSNILRKINPVSAYALTTFISFGVDRLGMINTSDILMDLLGLTEDEVKDIYDGKLNVFSGDGGELILSNAKKKTDITNGEGLREKNTKDRYNSVVELKKQGLSRTEISKVLGLCPETIRRYENMSFNEIMEKRSGKPITQKSLTNRNIWSDIITVLTNDNKENKITVYGFKNGSCASAAKELEWGWVSPSGDVFGGCTTYSSSQMLHDLLSDTIVAHEKISTEDSHSAYHILERLGWIKFEGGHILAEVDISEETSQKYESVARLITQTQKDFIAKYMQEQYMKHHTQPELGFTPKEYPITYIRVGDMELNRFAHLITH